jgi:hypothetical protein
MRATAASCAAEPAETPARARLGAVGGGAQDAPMRVLAGLFLLLLAGTTQTARGADEVTIYRCTDAAGRLTLRDTPCASNQKQQTRTMLRPRDETTPPVVLAPTRAVAAPAVDAPRLLVVRPPRPLYECIPPDGDPYTSDSPEGHPRWVPLWTLGYPVVVGRGGLRGGIITDGLRVDTGVQGNTGDMRGRDGHGDTDRGRHFRGERGFAYGAGTWVRDDCHALPQQEVCARLSDRRDEIRRRFFNAMPSERDTLRVEERGINARLDDDCGGH